MPGSKVWRKGRWFWSCQEENGALNWKDHWACAAVSRLTYSTEKEAARAGISHASKTGHRVITTQVMRRKNR